MNYYPESVANAEVADRATFLRRTYSHVAGAVGVFAILEAMLLSTPMAPALAQTMLSGRFSWLIVMGLFMLVSHVASKWAETAATPGKQYAGLGLYIAAQVVIFCPLLLIAQAYAPGIITKAAFITTGLFLGLTWIAITTKKDFSFMGGMLKVGTFVALGIIVAGAVFGFSLGVWFMGAMILLMAGMILYNTSQIMLHYPSNMHVAAALSLFASLATLFWYVIQLLLSLSNRD